MPGPGGAESVAPISPEDALDFGFTGPCLRATGIPFDVRKTNPYLGYETYDWDVPIAEGGDTYARYLVRLEELKILLQRMEEKVRLVAGNQFLRERVSAETELNGIFGSSAAIQDVLRLVARLKDTSSSPAAISS